ADPIDPARAWRPEKVRVRFPRRPLPTDGSSPWYTVDVALSAASGVVSGSFVQLDDDLAALGATGTPSNSAALSTRANERAADWLRKRSIADVPSLISYRDIQDAGKFLGSLIDRVSFDGRAGPRTQARSAPDGSLERWSPLERPPKLWPLPVIGAGNVSAANLTETTGAASWNRRAGRAGGAGAKPGTSGT